ncbi:MAG: hypothetical protein DIZ80_17015 [endosymbiont of Galathealinum brachiosum]|uniref:GGDEF domain-containing protein n=1 Tax=endosymbiont of Galathealinum brachiosum TaxID=2200906 RepID=A0A370D6T4_9GAMM|nr:MAG: hypothetical protein DIZ80_17015 [endosymbiont of Galathealinum brachiosum]
MKNTPPVTLDEHEQFMSKLRSVIDLTTSTVGDEYFIHLSEELSKAFDVEYVAISESVDNFKRIRTIAYWCKDELVPNVEYESKNTPCGKLRKNEITFYPSKLKSSFPLDPYIDELKAESYLGMPFYDSDGSALGIICLLGTKAMDKSIYNEYLLKIITARVSAEFIRRRAEQQLTYMATHDALTNIPNKMLFRDRLNTAISRAERNKSKFGLLFIDLNNFKILNDNFGHDTGDNFLIAISKKLKSCCRESDTLCRFGGDEFVIIIEAITDADNIDKLTKSLHQKVVNEDYLINDNLFQADLSIGAAIYPEHGINSDMLLQHADEAMYKAKKSHIPYKIYTEAHSLTH